MNNQLRQKCIEAGAEAESLHGFTEETQHLIAEDLLDEYLQVLADNADEWDDAAFHAAEDNFSMVGPTHYLAVLRNGRTDADSLEET